MAFFPIIGKTAWMTDPVRTRIRQLIGEKNLDMKGLSLAMGKNHAYLQQYLERGIPKQLSERSRMLLAERLGVDEAELGAPHASRHAGTAATHQAQIPEIDVHAGAGGGGFTALESHSSSGMTLPSLTMGTISRCSVFTRAIFFLPASRSKRSTASWTSCQRCRAAAWIMIDKWSLRSAEPARTACLACATSGSGCWNVGP